MFSLKIISSGEINSFSEFISPEQFLSVELFPEYVLVHVTRGVGYGQIEIQVVCM